MKKETSLYLMIAIIIVISCVTLGIIYYENNNSLKAINIKEIKSVTLYPFQTEESTKKAYTYDFKDPDDMKIVNNIINYLNTGKVSGVEKGAFVMWGGMPQHLVLELTDERNIDIRAINGLLVGQSSSNKTYKFDSPQLGKLFADEIKRIFNK